eukprot:CAMPEP_0173461404 /NCGR_PEP_ID=MMETSP1357-20121228/64887_1 /TAXON_ID=77926 /ORGANISM="Hemiselmis rufescens, Strain PCC563" /LENGTH=40 /DNA_ID= /DNA_START= /DNA_END= /DNA_ORIENTATION=
MPTPRKMRYDDSPEDAHTTQDNIAGIVKRLHGAGDDAAAA